VNRNVLGIYEYGDLLESFLQIPGVAILEAYGRKSAPIVL